MEKETTKKPENSGIIRDKQGKFIPGVSGNPAGKPEGTLSLTSMIKRKLQELAPDGKRDAMEVLADNIIQDALDSNNKMRQLIWNYVDGLPKQSIELSGQIEKVEVDNKELTEYKKWRKKYETQISKIMKKK